MHIMNFQIKLQKLPIALTSLLREVSDRLFVTAPNIGEGRFSCVPIWLRASASF